MLKLRQHVSAAVGYHQAKLEESLGILNVRTLECAHSITEHVHKLLVG